MPARLRQLLQLVERGDRLQQALKGSSDWCASGSVTLLDRLLGDAELFADGCPAVAGMSGGGN